MKAYIRIKHTGEFYDTNCYNAYAGCEALHIPVVKYKAVYSITDNDPMDPVIGTFSDVKVALEKLGIKPAPLDYPERLKSFIGRKIWKSTLFTITSHPECWHVFVKPIEDVKRFHGTVLDKSEDLIKLGGGLEDIDVWCSVKVQFLSEWRLWVLNGTITGLTPYKGRWDVFPDPSVMEEAVHRYEGAPSAYALDFGVTDDGRTLLVEVSDGYALASFGLRPDIYMNILKTRWQELSKCRKTENIE